MRLMTFLLACGVMSGLGNLGGSNEATIVNASFEQPVPLTPQQQAKMVTLPSGVKYVDVRAGKGVMAEKGRRVRVLYSGWLSNGILFDSRRDVAKPYDFQLGIGKVIKGLDEGIPGMRIGGRRRLIVPPALAYGAKGTGRIPPNSELTFDIELVGVSKAATN